MWSKIPSSKTALGSALIGGHAVQSCPLGLHLILWYRLKNSPLHPRVTQSVPWCHLFLWLQAALVQSTPSSHGSSPGLHKVGTVSAWESYCSCSGQVLFGMATLQQIRGFNHFAVYTGLYLCHWHPSLFFILLIRDSAWCAISRWASFQSLKLKTFLQKCWFLCCPQMHN